MDRRWIAGLVHLGEIPAMRRGRSILVAIEDIERWWRTRAGRVDDDARTWARDRVKRDLPTTR